MTLLFFSYVSVSDNLITLNIVHTHSILNLTALKNRAKLPYLGGIAHCRALPPTDNLLSVATPHC